MDLKWLLVKRITFVALACFLAGSAIALHVAVREAKHHNAELVELTGRQLDLQLSRIHRSTDIPARFPDWDMVTSYSLRPGQCVEYRDIAGTIQRSSCAGVDAASTSAPRWFYETYRSFMGGNLTAVRAVFFRGEFQGTVVAADDPVATAGQAWTTIAPMLSLSAAIVTVLCFVTYFVVDRALKPARDILEGLNQLAQGDLSCRLPSFRLAELNRISEVFNALSEELSKATTERAELARRLVDTQEQERRHIARELHDEIAQKLSALNALVACVRASAQFDAPGLIDETKKLEQMASGLMISLRRTLTYLRPQEIDDLGLIQSLLALVERHNDMAQGKTSYSIELSGELEQLGAETSAHVYRIIQEALTNASKHADARNVRVTLTQNPESEHARIGLSVIDDGEASPVISKRYAPAGVGLIGMRERVIALSGKFAAGPQPSGGFGLHVEFPTVLRGV
jgi:two-component system sensor histidine kinase UhpB